MSQVRSVTHVSEPDKDGMAERETATLTER
jgi:hypothetical protein